MSAPVASASRNDRPVYWVIGIFSVVVFVLVAVLGRLPKVPDHPAWVEVLPAFNAFINGTCFFLLLASLWFIRRRNIAMHRRINLLAAALSVVFLASYVTFHYFVEETRFPAGDPLRPVYLIILATHILLAALVLPLVLLSLYRGLTNQVERHRKIVRWSYPIWLYVTSTGVIVYLMIAPHYRF
jgi:putative membrane protein